MKDEIFREYDISGKIPNDINESVAYKIGLGYGSFLQEFLNQNTCIVSHDNRLSSLDLHKSLIKGLIATGINVIDYGLTTTPMHYYARYINNLFGIMITGSHNPNDINGFIFSFDEYANARGIMVKDLKTYIDKGIFKKGNGKVEQKNIKKDYINYIVNHLKFGKRKIKVILDLANGTTAIIARQIFENFNIDLTIINEEPDGTFPNHYPDPLIEKNLEQLKIKVKETKADIGISFDGDGDQFKIIDNLGNIISIESYAIIILRNIIDKITNKKCLYDALCSDNFKDEIIRLGGTPIICRPGINYIQEKIFTENIPFGITSTGTVFLNDRINSVESCIYASLRLIEILSKTDKSLNELINTVPKYLYQKLSFEVNEIKKTYIIESIKKYCNEQKYKLIEINGLKIIFKDSWAYIRENNIKNSIDLICESKNQNDLDNLIKIFSTLIDIYKK